MELTRALQNWVLTGLAWERAGVTTEEKYLRPENKIEANYYVNSIADFF